LQAKIIIIFFYFCTPSVSAPHLSYLTTKTTKFFTNSKKTGKNLFYVLFHHHLYYNSLCQPSTKLSSNQFTTTKLRYCIFCHKKTYRKKITFLGIPFFKNLTIIFLSLLTTKLFWKKTTIQFNNQQIKTPPL
jgi:hypothetical protein